jgi:rhodanese-related sulfurtransferase
MSLPTVTSVPDGALLLDVREADEWDAGHAPDAVHIPMNDVPSRLSELPTDRQIVAICRLGGRSAKVTEFLRAQGLDVHNYDGGMQAWAAAGGALTSSNGNQPAVI